MKYLHLCYVLLVLGCYVVDIQSLPIEYEPEELQQSQIPIILPEFIPAVLPAETESPEVSLVAAVPLSLLDVEKTDESSANHSEESQRSARGLGFGGLGGGFGGLGSKFGGLGLGFKSFGGFGHLGFGGLHGLGGGFGGFKSLFGKHFG